jgi:Skp family chaperone for outer membrane proteins
MMNSKTIFTCCITAVIVLALVFSGNVAQSKSEPTGSIQIGLVSVKRIFDECKKNDQYEKTLIAEQEKIVAELEKSRAEIDAERAGLKTLKIGSTEHVEQMRVLMEKQAKLTAEQEFHKQQLAYKERQWIENMYRDIVRITSEVAQKRELDLVLENSQVDLAEVPSETLIMSILMRSVLHSSGCIDITEEVMKQLDAGK